MTRMNTRRSTTDGSKWGSGGRPARVEHSVAYSGEKASAWSFFGQFQQIIFRRHGSALMHIWLEMVIAVVLGAQGATYF